MEEASPDPRGTGGQPNATPGVNGSVRSGMPRNTAAAGLTNGMTVDRCGPTSAMSLKKTRNAATVHSRPRAMTDRTTRRLGA